MDLPFLVFSVPIGFDNAIIFYKNKISKEFI
ncbi:hypothetical protein LKACC12383_00876 [Companilactobacillus kimchii]|uniref:Uncharacterized protein n=1 Tax=Companilactobacillus kimchii TaxID=2801452 RepID=A0A210PB87_9LACO|nr:hypothetical protein LKACC12383_00876 [Companilactobacillus kimchii]